MSTIVNSDKILVQKLCGTTKDLLWKINYKDNYQTLTSFNGLAMGNSDSKIKNGNSVLGYRKHNGLNQKWNLELISIDIEVKYLIKNIQTQICLDSGKGEIGNYYQLLDCDKKNKNQVFIFKYSNSRCTGIYYIINRYKFYY